MYQNCIHVRCITVRWSRIIVQMFKYNTAYYNLVVIISDHRWSYRWSAYITPNSPKRCLQKRTCRFCE